MLCLSVGKREKSCSDRKTTPAACPKAQQVREREKKEKTEKETDKQTGSETDRQSGGGAWVVLEVK